MALKLVEVTNAEELPEFVDVYSSAFNGSHVNRAMLPGGRTPEYNEHAIRQSLKTMGRRNQWRIAVVDTTIDKIICVALWKLENDPTNAESKIPTQWFSKANVEAKEAFFGMIDDARQAVMGNKTYWHLAILGTRPGHERKGAGRLALGWGIQRADRDGLDTFLDATPVGRPLYEKFGFESAKEQDLDLSPYGVDHLYHSTSMVRHPQKPDMP